MRGGSGRSGIGSHPVCVGSIRSRRSRDNVGPTAVSADCSQEGTKRRTDSGLRSRLLVVPILVGLLLRGLFLVLGRSLLFERPPRLLGLTGRLGLFTHAASVGCAGG